MYGYISPGVLAFWNSISGEYREIRCLYCDVSRLSPSSRQVEFFRKRHDHGDSVIVRPNPPGFLQTR